MSNDPKRTMLRHAVATLAYRAARACQNAPIGFADARASTSTRTAGEILSHMGDLFDWATKLAAGTHEWRTVAPLPWDEEVDRFFSVLAKFDAVIAGESQLACQPEQLLQGPVADALTHVGQLAMLRRASGSPMVGESYFKAEITIGHISKQLKPPAAPFKA